MTQSLSRTALGCLATIAMLWFSSPVQAQQLSAPGLDPSILMSAPVQSEPIPSAPVLLGRIALNVSPSQLSADGTASFYVDASTDSVLVLRVPDLSVQSIRLVPQDWIEAADSLDGDTDAIDEAADSSQSDVEWSVDDDMLTISWTSSSIEEEIRIDIDYAVRSALGFSSQDGEVHVVWSSSLPGRAGWMPTPVDQLEGFDIHLSVSTPLDWMVQLPTHASASQRVESSDRRWIRNAVVDAFPRSQGFVMWRQDADSTMIWHNGHPELDAADAFLESFLGISRLSERTVIALNAERTPTAFSGVGVYALGGLDSKDPWMRQYELNMRALQLRIAPLLGRLIPTDIWIESALSSWLAVEWLREQEGDAAAGRVLETLRDRYLRESSLYVRPLVWDRWIVASDLRDRHAEAKGNWVLRMLHERLGPSSFSEGIRRFLGEASTSMVDSETLRTTLSLVSRETLTDFFDTWVYAAGHPILSLSYGFDTATESTNLRIVQSQDGQLVPETFEFDAAFQYSTLAETNTVTIRVDEREQAATIPTGISPRFIHPDALATVPVDFATPPDQRDLVSQLRYSVDKTSAIRSLRLLSQTDLDATMLLGLRASLSQETDPAILVEAAPLLASMAPSASPMNMLIGWTQHADPRVRAAAVRALASYTQAPEAYDAALQLANTGSNGIELAAAVEALVTLRPESAWPVIQSGLVTPSDGELVRITTLGLVTGDHALMWAEQRSSLKASARDLDRAVRPLLDGPTDVAIAALTALNRVNPDDEDFRDIVVQWLEDTSSLKRTAAINIIGTWDSDDWPEDVLMGARDREIDIPIRRQLSAMIERLGAESSSPE